jgi:hypothetical protein
MGTFDGDPVDSGGGQRWSGLKRLKLPLPCEETLQTTGLYSLVLLLGEFRQPIRRSPQVLTQHRAAGDNLMLDRLLD